MRRSGKPQSVRPRPQTKFAKKIVSMIGYVLAGAIVAMAMAYWPASAGDILARLNLVPRRLAAAAVPDRTHKSDRLVEVRDNKSGREPPRTERRIEKIPFSCELAFSRIISKGNFSTRCIAVISTNVRLATAESSNKSR